MKSARFAPKDALLERLSSHLTVLKSRDAAAGSPEPPLGSEESQDEMWQRLQAMHRGWQLTPEPFRSHRRFIGPLVVKIRQLFNRISTLQFVQPLIQQQMRFNAAATQCSQQLVTELGKIRAAMRPSALGGEPAEEVLVDLRRNVGELKVLLRAQQRQIEALEREPHETPSQNLPGFNYFLFERRFRGSREAIKEKQQQYVHYFKGASDVLDIGCGRGEFMELLRENGVSSIGVDSDPDMATECRRKNLQVIEGDLLQHLRAAPDASFGGAYAAQIVEHLQPAHLTELIQLLGQKLRPGSPVVVETINPLCVLAAQTHYLLDLTHVRLIPPELIVFMLESAGFKNTETKYSSLSPEATRLEIVSVPSGDEKLAELVETYNRNVHKINGLFLGYQDYAVYGMKGGQDRGEPTP